MNRFFFCFQMVLMLSVFAGTGVMAQTPTELEIKDSSKGYLYAEAVADTEEEAISNARNMLRPAIETDELKQTLLNWKDVATGIVDNAPYMVKPRGNKMRAIVYLYKSDLPGLIEKYSKQEVKNDDPEPDPEPKGKAGDQDKEEMILMIKEHPEAYIFAEGMGTTLGKAEKSAQEKLGRPITNIIAKGYPAISVDKELIESIAYDTDCVGVRKGNAFYVLAYIKLSSFHCNLKKGVISGRSKCEGEIVEKPKGPDGEGPGIGGTDQGTGVTGPGNQNESEPEINDPISPLLKVIMDTKTINELRDVFITNKNKGKLVYGQMTTMPENSYLVVYNDVGEILTFYGIGTTVRKNLFSGKSELYKEAYPDGRVMWFQLFE